MEPIISDYRRAVGDHGPTQDVDAVHLELVARLRQIPIQAWTITRLETRDEGTWYHVASPDETWAFLVQGNPRSYARVVFPRPDGAEGGFEWDTTRLDSTDPLDPQDLVVWAATAICDHADQTRTNPAG